MNFHDLRLLVGQLKKSTACHKCKRRYKDEDLELLGSIDDVHTFFHADCPKCESYALINVSIDVEPGCAHPECLPRLGTSPRMGNVKADEVLDMHNFLREFKGDFSTLFQVE